MMSFIRVPVEMGLHFQDQVKPRGQRQQDIWRIPIEGPLRLQPTTHIAFMQVPVVMQGSIAIG
jgi:hypothetical protein